MDRRRVCYIGNNFEKGGAGTQFRNDVKGLQNIGCEVQVIDTLKINFSADLIDNTIDKILCSDLLAAIKLKEDRHLKKKTMFFINGRADCHLDPRNNLNETKFRIMIELKKLYRNKYIHIRRLMYFLDIFFDIQNHIRKIEMENGMLSEFYDVIKSLQPIYVPSNFWGEQLRKTIGINYVKIPLGLDKSYWFSHRVYEWRKNEIRILIPSGFLKFKKLEVGLEKINNVIRSLDKDYSIRCDFNWYNYEYKELKEIFSKKFDKINFIEPSSDPKNLFSQYDLMIHPSLGDTFCQVALECFSIGLPCLVSTISEDLLGDHVICINTQDEKYEDILKQLFIDYDLRKSLSEKAQHFAQNWITWEDRAKLIVKEAKI